MIEMKEQIKQLRVEIDGLTQLCEGLNPYKNLGAGEILPLLYSDEILESIKSLKLSKAWLGKELGSLGSENPYGSGYKTVEDIVPETDKALVICGAMSIEEEITPKLKAVDTFTLNGKIMNEYSQMSHIEKVDWLREEIKAVAQRLSNTINYNEFGVSNGELATIYLQEARFWLGFELGRIRDESN